MSKDRALGMGIEDDRAVVTPAHRRRRGHGWLMVICCAAPLLLLGGARLAGLQLTGGLAVVAMLACPAMHVLMMRGMHKGHEHSGPAAEEPRPRE